MNKYLYKIKDLEIPPWIKYWFLRKSKINFDLSEILNGTSFDLTDTVNKKLHLINIFGNSEQETTIGKNLLNPTRSDATASGVSISYDAETQILTLNGECTQDNLTFNLPNNSIHMENGDTIYLLVKYISGTSNGYFSFRCFNSDFSSLRYISVSDPIIQDLSYSSSITSNIDFTRISIRVDNGSTFNDFKFKLMVSTVDAVYEPYTDGASPNPNYPQEVKSSGDNGSIVEKFSNSDNTQSQVYTIPCQQPMRAIGNVKDTFVKVNGVWYERHNIGEFIANNNLLGNGITDDRVNLRTPALNIAINLGGDAFKSKVMCNLLQKSINNNTGLAGTTSTGEIRVVLSKDYVTTYAEANTFLTEKGLKIYWAMEVPIDLPCTASQITALESLLKARTYKNITHIYSDDEVPAELQIQYYKEKGE